VFGWDGISDRFRQRIIKFWTRVDIHTELQEVLDKFVDETLVTEIRAVVLGAGFLLEANIGEMLATALKARLPVPGSLIKETVAAAGVDEEAPMLMRRGAELIQLKRQLVFHM
jgi:hypothetical protein